MAVYVCGCCRVFSSPGTLPTLTSMVTGVADRRGLASGIATSAFAPAFVWSTRLRAVIARRRRVIADRDVTSALVVLALVGELDVEGDVRAGRDAVGRLAGLQRHVADGDADEAVAVQAGRGLAVGAARSPPPSAPSWLGDEPGRATRGSGRNWLSCDLLPADLLVVELLLDERERRARRRRRRRRGTAASARRSGRRPRPLVAAAPARPRSAPPRRSCRAPPARMSRTSSRLRCAPSISPGTSKPSASSTCRSALRAQLVDPPLEVDRRRRAAAEQAEELPRRPRCRTAARSARRRGCSPSARSRARGRGSRR